MDISKDLIRGHTDTIILNILSQGDSYGYQVSKSIRQLSSKQYELNEATLYTAFRRLEKVGDIRSYWGDQTQGARRKYYTLTDQGQEHFKSAQQEWDFAKDIINHLISGRIKDYDER